MNEAQHRAVRTPELAVPEVGAAFLLSQLGAHAAALFGQRIAPLDLTPRQAGLLRLVALQPGRSQQALADQLSVAASRIVALVDGLEARGLLERQRNPSDRRHYALHLTDRGTQALAEIRELASQHEDDLTAALDAPERVRLTELLQRIADQQHLEAGVHPDYQTLPSIPPAAPSGADGVTPGQIPVRD